MMRYPEDASSQAENRMELPWAKWSQLELIVLLNLSSRGQLRRAQHLNVLNATKLHT